MPIDPANPYGTPSEVLSATSAAATRTHAWKNGGPGFHDLLDAINPLQHIPVVSAVYRWLTGDVPGNVAELAGDALYGGPFGLAAGLFGIAFKEETGKDPGAMAISLLGGGETEMAAAATAPEPPVEATPVADGAAASAAPPVMPAHPPMPLVKTPPAAPLPLDAKLNAAESAFLAQSSLRQRALTGARSITQPIPLKLSGEAMQLAPLRMLRAAIAPTAPPSDAAPSVDIPQRMLDALDKYRRLEQQRGGALDLRQ